MRPLITAIFLILIFLTVAIFFRYEITVNSPLVVKLDRWTGKCWVANNGVWMDIENETKE